jgi:methylated-DNA-[protein]-cysteine S-methyltransferase
MSAVSPPDLVRRSVESPIGLLVLVASPTGLRAVDFGIDPRRVGVPEGDSAILALAAQQLAEYFAGSRFEFDLPLEPVGTPFQLSVWRVLDTIPYGETISYGEQARRLGDAKKARAVGGANGRNPLPIVVPCHRVIGTSGALTGFGGGLPIKEKLLKHEREVMSCVSR